MSPSILITGAAGYIGSHFVEELLESRPVFLKDARLILLDDLSSGSEAFIKTLTKLALQNGFPEPVFIKLDLLDRDGLSKVFETHRPNAVFHFAGKISVSESVSRPDYYFENNVVASKNLLDAMKASSCKHLVFSSTAAVYGQVDDPKLKNRPLREDILPLPINPYGKTKLMTEEAIRAASGEWGLQAVIFRYFNAAGASLAGRIGECHEPETHLIPLVIQAALARKKVKVFGVHYETRDGSCIRDYVHVKDLAVAHLLGLQKILNDPSPRVDIYNLGSERGSSVLEVVDASEVLMGETIGKDIQANRPGDSAILIADSSRARQELRWNPQYSSLHEILKTVLKWEKGRNA